MFPLLPLSILALATATHAHMEMSWPAPFRSKFNPHASPGKVDYSMTAPLKAGGADFPCKGYHSDMQDAAGVGAPVVTWKAGSPYNFTVVGGAPHNGGSCQAALSYDKGATFKVIHSYIGDCPLMNTGNFNFAVPSDANPGPAIFAWSWLNQVGNREYYMNCASVNIAGAAGGAAAPPPKVSFASRPNLFVANLGNGCTTVEGKDTVFPNPGPDVTSKSSKVDNSGSIVGNCEPAKSNPRARSESDPRLFVASGEQISVIPVATAGTRVPMPTAAPAQPAPPTTTGMAPGSMKVSADGECGGPQTCLGSTYGNCCSQFGFCGDSDTHCGYGCMEGYGTCGSNGTALKLRLRGPHFRYL
ncbi:unnamed protein product [Blumeria hordei]|uniref:Chitin-binding type-1 domain-containing protein n=2 Tax=Blumeria hordei TaxID=2867405 RepID=A0A383UYW0_BLUHO|nr:endoglucanase [Blumeria hordei DH14]SZF05553.1 unnamed protein product [Blumeria hordei]